MLCSADRKRLSEEQRSSPVVLDLNLADLSRTGGSTTLVTAVYPSAQVLPENLLRFYIHFSAPMSRGEAYRHVRLLDAAGKAVDLPFLELDQELWDPDGKRFTGFMYHERWRRSTEGASRPRSR